MEYRIAKLKDFEMRSDEGPGWAGGFEGYLTRFDAVDTYGTRFRKGAFTAGGLDDGIYPLLFQHGPEDRREWDVNRVIGTFNANEDGDGLVTRARFAKTQAGQDARELAFMGAATDLSHGFENRMNNTSDPKEIVSCRLVEGSLVVTRIGSTPGAGVMSVRAKQGRTETRALAGSVEAKQEKIREAIDAAYPGPGWNYIVATYNDFVVFEVQPENGESKTYKSGYSVAPDGSVTLGTVEEVEITESLTSTGSRLAAIRAAARLRLSAPILRR